MNPHFDEKANELLWTLLQMGGKAGTMLKSAMQALADRNPGPVEEILRLEDEVDGLQLRVDEEAIRLTALAQPVASDVRFLFMASRMAHEIERIADKSVSIGRHAIALAQVQRLPRSLDLPAMGQIASAMLRTSLDALLERDCGLAESVLAQEEKIDAYRDRVIDNLMIGGAESGEEVRRTLWLALVARALERIGDHASNIAEDVIYLVRGQDVRHRRPVPPPEAEPIDATDGDFDRA